MPSLGIHYSMKPFDLDVYSLAFDSLEAPLGDDPLGPWD
jgi:hypothetical protein